MVFVSVLLMGFGLGSVDWLLLVFDVLLFVVFGWLLKLYVMIVLICVVGIVGSVYVKLILVIVGMIVLIVVVLLSWVFSFVDICVVSVVLLIGVDVMLLLLLYVLRNDVVVMVGVVDRNVLWDEVGGCWFMGVRWKEVNDECVWW